MLPSLEYGHAKHAGLVNSHKHGRESRYMFDAEGMQMARAYLDMASAQWDAAALRLNQFVEST